MNVALLVNSHNIADIQSFVDEAVRLQKNKTPGAIAVSYQDRLGKKTIEDLVAPLLPSFSAAVSIPVPVAASAGSDGQIATLFSLFLSQAYARFPGPWLVIDGPGVPTKENFIEAVDKQHKALSGPCSGRYSLNASGLIPVGPVVIGLPFKSLQWFTPSLAESWRVRARHVFGRCGFKKVPAPEYLFAMPGERKAEQEEAPSGEIASTQPELKNGDYINSVGSVGGPAPTATASPYDNLSDEDLRTQIEIRDLPKPHHKTGRAKLLEILFEADEARKSNS